MLNKWQLPLLLLLMIGLFLNQEHKIVGKLWPRWLGWPHRREIYTGPNFSRCGGGGNVSRRQKQLELGMSGGEWDRDVGRGQERVSGTGVAGVCLEAGERLCISLVGLP